MSTSRAINFDSNETEHLKDLVRQYPVVNDKGNDTNSNKKKAWGWDRIYEAFVAKYGNKRSLKELKEKWKRMKMASKKNAAEFRKDQIKTGGGPGSVVLNRETLEIQAMCPSDFVAINNEFDDDGAANMSRPTPTVPADEFLAAASSQGFDLDE